MTDDRQWQDTSNDPGAGHDPSASMMNDSSQPDAAQTMGIEGGLAAPQRQRIPGGLILLGMVLAVATGALYAMRASGNLARSASGDASVEAKIEAALAAMSGEVQDGSMNDAELDADAELVIARLAGDATEKQVELEELSKNPFLTQLLRDEDGEAEGTVDRAMENRRKRLQAELENFKLQSVVNGSAPMALISDQVVKPGDAIGSFQVQRIDAMSVTLSAAGEQFRLSMDESLGHVP